ncbi:MAG: prenyltransferase [Desulfobacteraceae bacterium]
MKQLIIWIKETRPQFLTLAVALTFMGTAIAWYYGPVNMGYALLAGFGLMLTHGSANAVNDYFDYKSGIDLEVEKTPFSGGSGLIKEEQISLTQALWVGIATSLTALGIGVFFCIVKGWMLLPLIIAAVLCLVLYTPVILKTPWPEWSPGLGLGILPILALYFIQFGRYNWAVLAASVASGIMVHNLLLLNEFPDVEADRNGGRKTTPVVFGLEASWKFFTLSTLAVYVWIGGCVGATIASGRVVMPAYSLIAFLSLPWALKAVRGSRQYHDRPVLIQALGNNVCFILITHVLIGSAYILAKLFPL